MTKKQLIDAIMGREPVCQVLCQRLTRAGLMKFTGNQWNEGWSWIRSELEKMDKTTLTLGYEDPQTFLPFTPDQHFLPDYHDCGDLSGRLQELITVPIKRVKAKLIHELTGNEPPFEIFACTWVHLDVNGALTREKFEEQLNGALQDMANGINELGEFRAYPVTHFPPTTYGRAYHDWVGIEFPFDLRFVISYDTDIDNGAANDQGEKVLASGLKFFLMTLIEKPADEAGK